LALALGFSSPPAFGLMLILPLLLVQFLWPLLWSRLNFGTGIFNSRLCVLEFFVLPQFFVARSPVSVFASRGFLPAVIFFDLVLLFIYCLVCMSPGSVPVLPLQIHARSTSGAFISRLFSPVCDLVFLGP
jgi:hypothetical protein